MVKGHSKKPIAATTVESEFGDSTFAELFVSMKKLAGPIIVLQFMRHKGIEIDTTHGLIHFPLLTKQIKGANSEKSANPNLISATTS